MSVETLLSSILFAGGIKMNFKARAGILFIMTGIIIISWAVYARWSTDRKQKAMIDQFNSVVEKYEEEEEENTHTAKESIDDSADTVDVDGMIGILSIPKIDLKVAVVDGVDSESLKKAVGHFPGTAMPGERGNCAISGHRSFTYNQFFNRLNEVEAGDEIKISTMSDSFTYIVYEKKIVNPDDISVLDDTDDTEITLITCHPERSSAQRLIVRGKIK